MFCIKDLEVARKWLPIIYINTDLNYAFKIYSSRQKIEEKYPSISFLFVFDDQIAEEFDSDVVIGKSHFEKIKFMFLKNYKICSKNIDKFFSDNQIEFLPNTEV